MANQMKQWTRLRGIDQRKAAEQKKRRILANAKKISLKRPPLAAGSAGAREAWLEEGYRCHLAALLVKAAADAGLRYKAPSIRVTCGWPSRGAMPGGKKTRIGECWSPSAAADDVAQVFISPLIEKPLEALDILIHEAIHALVGTEAGHKGPFAAVARAVGLEGKLTATVAGDDLRAKLEAIAAKLGDYPHVKLNPALSGLKHQKNRHIKAECPVDGCGYLVRMSRKLAAERGCPFCPQHMVALKLEGGGVEIEDAEDGSMEDAG